MAAEQGEAHRRRVERAVTLAEEQRDRLLCIVGPTASGKTELAIDVCARVGGEIVSADSVQIYRGFDLGSGKPTAEERARAPHHVIDVLDPLETADAMTFARLAEAAIADIRARGRLPILCGGTFFWVRSLVLGLAPAPSADEAIRARHRALVAEHGAQALHEELRRVDPVSATRLHPNDVLRVSRALEVHELSGRPMSEHHAEHGFRSARMESAMIGVATTPEQLTERIARRVDGWLEQGWIDEVRGLVARGHGDARAMGSVGYAEVRAHVAGTLPREALRDLIVQSTRIFARKQRTWLKSAPLEWL
ncbi:MAG TPA: tRNA (adenosine(37)-N6)-dimethylallyltransferase MiaA [Labilithrix sp.]|nr:tRNA (adenosine(37)-N6)-dimethylallyltransferase MiaA [Labilithrix sp.]